MYCPGCADWWCDEHWTKLRSHLPGGKGLNNHEQIDPDLFEQVEHCMAAPNSDTDQIKQHQHDGDTTWLGVGKGNEDDLFLDEYRRYAAIMLESATSDVKRRHPALVSFVGGTGKQMQHYW